MTRILVILSGGLDSATCLGMAVNKHGHKNVEAVTYYYGQRHTREIRCARILCDYYHVIWHEVNTEFLGKFGGSALTDEAIEVPEEGYEGGIPISYVPGRNTIFIAAALSLAETRNIDEIWTGVNAVDYSGYPDCRPEYIEAWNCLASLSSKRAVEGSPITIETPIISLTKDDIVKVGLGYNIPYQHTWSCYNGRDKACGVCDSCRFRRQAFINNGTVDPIEYEE